MTPESTPPADPTRPPVAERRPHTLRAHGDERVDDWYWTRDRDDPSLLPLIEAENAYAKAATAHLEPLVEQVYQEILARTELTDVTYPAPKGDWAYYVRTVDGKQHAISCRRPRGAPAPAASTEVPADEHESVMLDENELAEGHEYFEVGDAALSQDQRLLAYSCDTTGGEVLTVRLRDLSRGEDLEDVIEGASYGLAFSADNATLFYTRPDAAMRPFQVWRHRLASPANEDVKVFEEPDERFSVGLGTTKDGELIVIQVVSNETSECHTLEAARPDGRPAVVAPRRQGVLYSLEHHHGELLVLSNDGAENFALFRTPLSAPGRGQWEVLLEERSDVRLEALDVVEGHALVEERGHAATSVRILPLGGGEGRLIEAPPAGTVALAENLEFDTGVVRYQTTTLVQPRRLYELDLATGSSELLWRQPVPGGYDPDRYRTERRWATSADGTEVPLTLAWRLDRAPGPAPVLLYGYGAYGASSDPAFATRQPITPLLDRGVTYVIAHVRGGEELGRHWYLDGRLEHKHHSFEDFVAVARYLVEEGWTTPAQLAALGRSAGGLLVGASLNLAPEAFGAVVAEVPFVDALSTILDASLPLTVGEWEEWGDPIRDPAAYHWIKAYSPYDNVRSGPYPRVLVTSGMSDPRVAYFEPVKWVQKLRAANPDRAGDILLLVELSAGHFGPSGRYNAWRKLALVFAFILDAIGAGGVQADDGGEEGLKVTS